MPLADNGSFDIQSLELLSPQGKTALRVAHNSRQFKIIYLVSGTGKLWIDLQAHAVAPQKIFCIKPGQIQHFESEDILKGYVISFSEHFFEKGTPDEESFYFTKLYHLLDRAQEILIPAAFQEDIVAIAQRMLREFTRAQDFSTEILKRYFKIFLFYVNLQVESASAHTGVSRNKQLVQQFLDLLEKHFKQKKMVADYAGDLCVTPNYLNEIIKKVTGFSAGHHIRQRIVLEAKRQAAYSGVCMKEIGYYLGFSDMAHFSKFFKNTTGMNFSDFKKQRLTMAAM